MNVGTGIFTASKAGVYHFHFAGWAFRQSKFSIFLRLNGGHVVEAWADAGKSGDDDAASLHSTLQLNQGDQVDLWLREGSLYGSSSQFTGWLDEESLQL